MQSKTSFFDKTVYKKNLSRFAPVWGLYTLCLVMGVVLLYVNGGSMKEYHFANNYISDLLYITVALNLIYALVVAQLLFGDLFNSRMCNMLHAFPIRRESWFVTNVVSGLTFSLVPTGLMALVSVPLLLDSMFENAVALAFWVFLASNLEFLCFFGMAAFAAMCTANRFTMAAGYGLLNAGAMIAYWLVDTVYTPLLYGVVTPTALMWNLTPVYHMSEFRFLDTEFSLWDLRERYGYHLDGVTLTYTVTDNWWHLWLVAGVGVVFLVLALVLYKKRDLECAGDAVAFSRMVPVFEVLCAVFVATAAQYSLENILGFQDVSRWMMLMGLTVGWFVAKMLVERSARVFRLQNGKGLVVLTAVFAISLALTHFDVLGIEDSIPEAAKVKSVMFGTDWTSYRTLEKPEDIEAMLGLQKAALAERCEESGIYLQGYDGGWVLYSDTNDHLYNKDDETLSIRKVAQVSLSYELENGKIIKRRYNVWTESEAGRITENYLNAWEALNPIYQGEEKTQLERVMEEFVGFRVGYAELPLPEICLEKHEAVELLLCMDLDRVEGNMAPHPYFHTGVFRYKDTWSERGYSEAPSVSVCIEGREFSWYVDIYADAVHTIRWLQNKGLLDWEVRPEGTILW